LGEKKEFKPFALLTDIYNEFHNEKLDALNVKNPFDAIVGEKKFFIGRLNNEIGKMESEDLIRELVHKARMNHKWQPLILDNKTDKFIGYKKSGMDSNTEAITVLLEKGLVSKHDMPGSLSAFIPTDAFIDFVQRAMAQQ